MSYDNYTAKYYLTHTGWIRSEEWDGTNEYLEIWEKEVYQGSGFGRESESWKKIWSNPNVSAQLLEKLHTGFPFPRRAPLSEDSLKAIREGTKPQIGKK